MLVVVGGTHGTVGRLVRLREARKRKLPLTSSDYQGLKTVVPLYMVLRRLSLSQQQLNKSAAKATPTSSAIANMPSDTSTITDAASQKVAREVFAAQKNSMPLS